MIDTVISDLGQVILHFDNNIFFRRLARLTGRSEEEIRAAAEADREIIRLFDLGKISAEEFYAKAKLKLDVEVSYGDFYASYCDIFSLDRPVLAVFAKLKPKYKLVLLSNTDIMRFTFIKTKFREILIFDAYALSFDLGIMKPEPDIYRKALRLAGSRAENAVYIDDLPENIEAAENVGLKGILFTPQTDLEAELRKFGICF